MYKPDPYERMTFGEIYKLHFISEEDETVYKWLQQACSKDITRPLLHCLFARDGFVYATNGWLVNKAWMYLYYESPKDPRPIHNGVYLPDKNYLRKVVSFEGREPNGPDIEAVKPRIHNPVDLIGINPELLKAAMIPKGHIARFEFSGEEEPIAISQTCGHINCWSLLMPMRLDNER